MNQTPIDYVHIKIEPGRLVICDLCGEDWTDRTESGGIYGFMTKAACPECTPAMEQGLRRHGEEKFIFARCPANMSFADWVRDVLRK